MQYPSKPLARAVDAFASLPGVGRRTALRLALHTLRQPKADGLAFADAISHLVTDVQHCTVCHNVSDTDVCPICASPRRDHATVCVVEGVQDVMALEATAQYQGLYHVLGGLISPMDGVGPGSLQIDSLVERVQQGGITEVVLALSSTMEGDTTAFYIARRLEQSGVRITALARGIAMGDELQYADEATLGRALTNRVPFGN